MVPPPAPTPVPLELEQLLHRLLGGGGGGRTVQPAPPAKTGITAMETKFASCRPRTPGLDCSSMFLVWKNRSWGDPMSCTGCVVSFLAAGMEGGEGREQIHYDLSPCGSGEPPGGKRRMIRGGGSAARISNGTGPQDPGGGEAWLTAPQDTAVTRPVFQPKPRLVVECSDEVEGSAVVVEADGLYRILSL